MRSSFFALFALLSGFAAAHPLLVGRPAAAAALQKRIDERLVYQFGSKYSSAADACNAWRCACINYVPKDSDLSFEYAYCEPGAMGPEDESTEVSAFCSFENDSTNQVQEVNKHTAATVGFVQVQ